MTPSPKISLCMIVKDEAEWLEACIGSVAPILYEAIVVDTGSTDDSVRLAKRAGALVYHYEWQDDFAAARNYSLSRAFGDWILVLDADEVIANRDLEKLLKLTDDPKCCYELTQRHYTNDHRLSDFTPVKAEDPELERGAGGYFESSLVRLFPNAPGLYYKGRVHELVEHSIRDTGRFSIAPSGVRIHHYGHTEKVNKRKDKSLVYSPLGETKVLENPHHWQAFFELAVEHNRNGRYKESVDAFIRSIELNGTYLPSWINLGYVLCELGHYDDAVIALTTALRLDPRSDEAWCNMGVAYLRSKALDKAEAAFVRAVEINPGYVNAWCNLGKTLAHSRRFSESAHAYKRALRVMPGCTVAKADLGAIFLESGDLETAEGYLRAAIKDSPESPITKHHLQQLTIRRESVEKARRG